MRTRIERRHPRRQTHPDRVKEKITFDRNREIREGVHRLHFHDAPSTRMTFGMRNFGNRFLSKMGILVASAAALTALGNANIERRTPTGGFAERIASASGHDLMTNVRTDIGRIVGGDFAMRFISVDGNGNSKVNADSLVFPFTVGWDTVEEVPFTTQFEVPYWWAEQFRQARIEQRDPARTRALEQQLVAIFRQQIPNHVVIHGISGMDTTGVWRAQGRNLRVASDGSLLPPGAVPVEISGVTLNGLASDEANPNNIDSLGGADPENGTLAHSRAEDLQSVITSALREAGYTLSANQEVRILSTENILNQHEISELSRIASRQRQWERLGGTDGEFAMRLVQAYNDHASLELTPTERAFLQQVLDSKRGVQVSVTGRGEERTFESINLGIALPLFVLFALGFASTSGGPRTVERPFRERVVTVGLNRNEVARRIFRNDNPEALDMERDFNQLYDSVNLNPDHAYDVRGIRTAGPKDDLYNTLRHLLVEEVGPSLNPRTREPFIDYMELVNKSLPHKLTNALSARLITKADGSAYQQAQRHLALELVRMWEHHDQAVYPMEESPLGPIDVKTTLHYEHDPYVVMNAKVLAAKFVEIQSRLLNEKRAAIAANPDNTGRNVQPIVTTHEFETALRAEIEREARGYSSRFASDVTSEKPDPRDYRANVGRDDRV